MADVLVFVGDNSHNGNILRKNLTPEIPIGLNFECTNADVLHNRIKLENQKMVLPEGNAFSYLILKNIENIRLSTLQRIKEISDAGVVIIGEKPKSLAGYKISEADKNEFESLVDTIWSKPNCKLNYDFNTVEADFEVVGEDQIFLHRKTDEEDIYFFNNETDKAKTYECVFRISNKIPELWDAETGAIRQLAQFKNEGNLTRVWLKLRGEESAFIVFRKSSIDVVSIVKPDFENEYRLDQNKNIVILSDEEGSKSVQLNNGETINAKIKNLPKAIDISSNWEVEFLEKHHFASKEDFTSLTDWKDNENEDIKYYSGTAIYSKTVKLPKLKSGIKTFIDLGEVNIVAEVFVNGKVVDVLWKAPFIANVSNHVKKGDNVIEVKITNQWSNRMIGDKNYSGDYLGYQQPSYFPSESDRMPDWYVKNEPMPEGPRSTFNTYKFYSKGDDLMPSGLLGPVKIIFKKEKVLK